MRRQGMRANVPNDPLPDQLHQRIMDGKAEQEGHQLVPLFASFSLPHRVPPTCFVFPTHTPSADRKLPERMATELSDQAHCTLS